MHSEPQNLNHLKDDENEARLKRKRSLVRIFWAIFCALAVHIIAAIPLSEIFKQREHAAQKKPSIKYLNTKLVPKSEKKDPKKELDEKKQVVSVAPTNPQQRPDKADFLAEVDQKTDRQTKAAQTSKEPELLAAKPSIMPPPSPPLVPNQKSKPLNPNQLEPDNDGASAPQKLAERGLLKQKQPKMQKESSQPQAQASNPLLPTWKDFEQVKGMPFSDSLDKVETDAATSLNTWQWKHAPFFNRIKERVARIWNPQLEIQKHDPTGRMLGKQDRQTIVKVVIDRTGNLKDLDVEKGSGVSFLDDESLRAFKVAAPFSNPPASLFTQGDTFAFDFGFQVSFEKGFEFDFNWRSN